MSVHQSRKKATLKDVATAAGVSTMTVSNVVNGRTSRVGEDVRKLVLGKIEDLRYIPHLKGRALRLSRDFSVGLVMLHPERRFLNDPFNTEVAAGLSNRVAREGYGVLVFGAQNAKDLGDKMPRISQLDALAIYIFGDTGQRRAVYSKLSQLELPMVLIGDTVPEGLQDVSYVRQKNEEGAFELARRGIDRGAKSILFMRPDHFWPAMAQRESGVRRAAKGRADVSTMICTEIDFHAVIDQVKQKFMEVKPDLIMGGNDLFGIAATQAVSQLGLKVGSAPMITGFNGFGFREYSVPLLTSMRSPAYEIGEEAADQLIKRITNGYFPAGKDFDVEFLAGHTC